MATFLGAFQETSRSVGSSRMGLFLIDMSSSEGAGTTGPRDVHIDR
jgi:hypothetical protein